MVRQERNLSFRRLVVTGQMIADLVILGLAVKIILGAVSRRQPGIVEGPDAT